VFYTGEGLGRAFAVGLLELGSTWRIGKSCVLGGGFGLCELLTGLGNLWEVG